MIVYASNTLGSFKAQFMQKLINIKAEFKKSLSYKISVYSIVILNINPLRSASCRGKIVAC